MADLNDDDHLFEEMSPESPGTIGRNIVRRLGLASQVAEAIRSPNNNNTIIDYNLTVTVYLTIHRVRSSKHQDELHMSAVN